MVGEKRHRQYRNCTGQRGWHRAGLAVFAVAIAAACVGCAASAGTYADVRVASGPGQRSLTNAELVAKSDDAVAVVETGSGRGLGFVIDPAGYLVTNRHVVEDADYVERVVFPAYDPPRVYESVQVIYTDPLRDLALLRIHTDGPIPSLPLASKNPVAVTRYLRREDPVVVLRRQEKKDGSASLVAGNAEVTDLAVPNPSVGPSQYVRVSADVARGQSGGPILDRFGRVVGVITWTWKDRVGGYAISVSDVLRMLADRPELQNDLQHHDRAIERSRDFLAALGRGDVDDARRLTSPSHARELRAEAVGEILADVDGGGMPALRSFLAATEALVDEAPERQADRLRELVSRTATSEFRTALGISPAVAEPQVVSFFFELGQAYLLARSFGEMSQPDALEAAMMRLQTIDAARTFALADVLGDLAGNQVEVEAVRVLPGAYGRKAVVSLRMLPAQRLVRQPVVTSLVPPGERLTLHMKLEWGDWYVSEVARTPLTDAPPTAG